MRRNKDKKQILSDTQSRILQYLRSGLNKGKYYFKSKYIASDLGLSPKEVGTNLAILSNICEELIITRWSYSNSTTWRVSFRAS